MLPDGREIVILPLFQVHSCLHGAEMRHAHQISPAPNTPHQNQQQQQKQKQKQPYKRIGYKRKHNPTSLF